MVVSHNWGGTERGVKTIRLSRTNRLSWNMRKHFISQFKTSEENCTKLRKSLVLSTVVQSKPRQILQIVSGYCSLEVLFILKYFKGKIGFDANWFATHSTMGWLVVKFSFWGCWRMRITSFHARHWASSGLPLCNQKMDHVPGNIGESYFEEVLNF